MGDIKGDPGTTTTTIPPIIPPAGYDFGKGFFDLLAPALLTGTLPGYQGAVDPGISPTMQAAMQMGQGYAASPAPGIMGQVQGGLGQFANLSQMQGSSPWEKLSPFTSGGGLTTGGGGGDIFNLPQPQKPTPYPGGFSPWANQGNPAGGGGGGALGSVLGGGSQYGPHSGIGGGMPASQGSGPQRAPGPIASRPTSQLGQPASQRAPGPIASRPTSQLGQPASQRAPGPIGPRPTQMIGPPGSQRAPGPTGIGIGGGGDAMLGVPPSARAGGQDGRPWGATPSNPGGGGSFSGGAIDPNRGRAGGGSGVNPNYRMGGGAMQIPYKGYQPPNRGQLGGMPPFPGSHVGGDQDSNWRPGGGGFTGGAIDPNRGRAGGSPRGGGGPTGPMPTQMLGQPPSQRPPGWQMHGGPQMLGQPPSQSLYPSPGSNPQNVGPRSAMDVYRSAVPVMEAARDRNISQSLAQSGMGGNRFGTNSSNDVAQIGADTGLAQNQLMTELLNRQANQDLDRSQSATQFGLGMQQTGEQNAMDRYMQSLGMGMNLGGQTEKMMQDRIQQLFGMGQWEQGRADHMAQIPYQDFMQSRLGYLPYLMNMIGQQPSPAQGQPSTTSTAGTPGLLDYAGAVPWGAFFGAG